MNKTNTTAKNIANNIRKRTYIDWTTFIWIPVGTKAVKNPIENMPSTKQIFKRNSISLVSSSYCDGIYLIKF